MVASNSASFEANSPVLLPTEANSQTQPATPSQIQPDHDDLLFQAMLDRYSNISISPGRAVRESEDAHDQVTDHPPPIPDAPEMSIEELLQEDEAMYGRSDQGSYVPQRRVHFSDDTQGPALDQPVPVTLVSQEMLDDLTREAQDHFDSFQQDYGWGRDIILSIHDGLVAVLPASIHGLIFHLLAVDNFNHSPLLNDSTPMNPFILQQMLYNDHDLLINDQIILAAAYEFLRFSQELQQAWRTVDFQLPALDLIPDVWRVPEYTTDEWEDVDGMEDDDDHDDGNRGLRQIQHGATQVENYQHQASPPDGSTEGQPDPHQPIPTPETLDVNDDNVDPDSYRRGPGQRLRAVSQRFTDVLQSLRPPRRSQSRSRQGRSLSPGDDSPRPTRQRTLRGRSGTCNSTDQPVIRVDEFDQRQGNTNSTQPSPRSRRVTPPGATNARRRSQINPGGLAPHIMPPAFNDRRQLRRDTRNNTKAAETTCTSPEQVQLLAQLHTTDGRVLQALPPSSRTTLNAQPVYVPVRQNSTGPQAPDPRRYRPIAPRPPAQTWSPASGTVTPVTPSTVPLNPFTGLPNMNAVPLGQYVPSNYQANTYTSILPPAVNSTGTTPTASNFPPLYLSATNYPPLYPPTPIYPSLVPVQPLNPLVNITPSQDNPLSIYPPLDPNTTTTTAPNPLRTPAGRTFDGRRYTYANGITLPIVYHLPGNPATVERYSTPQEVAFFYSIWQPGDYIPDRIEGHVHCCSLCEYKAETKGHLLRHVRAGHELEDYQIVDLPKPARKTGARGRHGAVEWKLL